MSQKQLLHIAAIIIGFAIGIALIVFSLNGQPILNSMFIWGVAGIAMTIIAILGGGLGKPMFKLDKGKFKVFATFTLIQGWATYAVMAILVGTFVLTTFIM